MSGLGHKPSLHHSQSKKFDPSSAQVYNISPLSDDESLRSTNSNQWTPKKHRPRRRMKTVPPQAISVVDFANTTKTESEPALATVDGFSFLPELRKSMPIVTQPVSPKEFSATISFSEPTSPGRRATAQLTYIPEPFVNYSLEQKKVLSVRRHAEVTAETNRALKHSAEKMRLAGVHTRIYDSHSNARFSSSGPKLYSSDPVVPSRYKEKLAFHAKCSGPGGRYSRNV